jgi:putative sugar O-methyltransferase
MKNNNTKLNQKLADEFISNTKNFYEENLNLIDNKHKKIIKSFYTQIKENKSYFRDNLRNWTMQTDYECPPQITNLHFKNLGFWKYIKFYFKRKIQNIFNDEHNRAFFDDIEILKKNCDINILKKNPVHLTPGAENFYVSEEIITNYRWNRYLYISDRIIKKKILEDNDTWVDIGPFYGGLQSIIKKEKPSVNIILVDFKHQLCRSYIFLKQLFPNSNHFFPDKVNSNLFMDELRDSIVYLPVEKYNLLENLKVKLITNFFSFGEMKDEVFDNYKNSNLYKNAKYKFLVNRFVSSPFFEKTYGEIKTNVLNYTNEKDKVCYFDIFPIHHYHVPKRMLFNSFKNRPCSSPYFELLLKKI